MATTRNKSEIHALKNQLPTMSTNKMAKIQRASANVWRRILGQLPTCPGLNFSKDETCGIFVKDAENSPNLGQTKGEAIRIGKPIFMVTLKPGRLHYAWGPGVWP